VPSGMAPAPGMAPDTPPGMAAGSPPGAAPGMAPGAAPGMGPGAAPGMAPGTAPGMAAGAAPGSPPGAASGAAPGMRPGTAPGMATVPGAGAGPETIIGVVCDGVSTSPRPDEASQTAADTAAAVIAERLAAGADPVAATGQAVLAAARAVAALADSPYDAPACTLVSAVVSAEHVTVGWVGDSRAYWLAGPGSTLLTRDDAAPGHMLTAWLGADAGEVVPHVQIFAPEGPGVVLVCSDGLWNYFPEPSALAEAVPDAAADPLAAARTLVNLALQAGGRDNITVLVIPFAGRR
jgi:Serine/threonine protein phosphatase